MKPQDLKLAQLKAIPLEEYNNSGWHKKGGTICDIIYERDCYEPTCHKCILDTPDSVKDRISELEQNKNKNP